MNKIAKGGLGKSIDFIRCKARLKAGQAEFGEAAVLWAKVCEMRKSDSMPENERSWQWWRAKFYELECLAKEKDESKKQVLHTIEVLENSFTDIPPFWAEKLNILKQMK